MQKNLFPPDQAVPSGIEKACELLYVSARFFLWHIVRHYFEHRGEIRARQHVVDLPVERSFDFSRCPELSVIPLALFHLEAYQLVQEILIARSAGTADQKLERVEIFIDIVEKAVEVGRGKRLARFGPARGRNARPARRGNGP